MIPIIDVRPYTDGDDDVHDIVANHITRARLIAANGHAGNQVFRTYAPGTPIQPAQRYVLDAMDEWLNNIARDTAPARSALEKVVRNKPSNLVDTCYLASLDPVTDPSRCQAMFPVASQSTARRRIAAHARQTEVRAEARRSSGLQSASHRCAARKPARGISGRRLRLQPSGCRQASAADVAVISRGRAMPSVLRGQSRFPDQ